MPASSACWRARVSVAAGDREGAARLCHRVLKVAPPDSPAHSEALCNLGVAQMHAQQFEEAYHTYSAALSIDPYDAETR
jgi:Flp pilus assembly protein TadD